MKGYRVSPLTNEGKIPDEIGEIHYFSTSFERAEWWARRLPNEDVQYVSLAYDYGMNGYAIMEIEAEEVTDDRYFSEKIDFCGKIISAKAIKVVSHKRGKSWWKKLSSKIKQGGSE